MEESIARKEFWVSLALLGATALGCAIWRQQMNWPIDGQHVLAREKLTRESGHDVVATGDSRLALGVNPDELGLGRHSINFGFANLGYASPYFERVDSLFNKSGRRILLCGVSPTNFAKVALEDNGFLQAVAKKAKYGDVLDAKVELLVQTHLPSIPPISPTQGVASLTGREIDSKLRIRPHFNGWAEGDRLPHDPMLRTPKDIKRNPAFDVDQPRFEQFLSWLKSMKRQGVEVYCFWPPTGRESLRREELRSGWTRGQIASRIRDAGLVWIELEPKYDTFDGVHLAPSEARQFSRDLGQAIVTSSSK